MDLSQKSAHRKTSENPAAAIYYRRTILSEQTAALEKEGSFGTAVPDQQD